MDEIPKAGGQVTAPRSHGASQTADCPAMGAKIETVGESGFDLLDPPERPSPVPHRATRSGWLAEEGPVGTPAIGSAPI